MAWTTYQIVLAIVLVVTGSINTLTTTWADKMKAKGSDGKTRLFDHPFVQSCCMFFGEILCLFVFKIMVAYGKRRLEPPTEQSELTRGNQNFNAFIFMPAAMCDMIGTSLMYVGLNLTNASSFQMLRGSVIVFVAILSVKFLRRKLCWKHWLGIVLVIVGLIVVGVSDYLIDTESNTPISNGIIGDLIIVGAQVITAAQMVYEEKFVSGKDIPPLQAVGWEGIFGFGVLTLLLIPFYFIHVPAPFSNNAHGSLEDFPDAMIQCYNNQMLIVSLVGTIISIAFFNFAGISVTKELSATTRMVLDSVRTIFIWGFSLLFKWQKFHPLQILGFVFLLMGMCIYNNIVPSLSCNCCRRKSDEVPITTSQDQI